MGELTLANALNKKCIENGKLERKYTIEFFYNIYSRNQNYGTSYSSDRQGRTYHILFVMTL
jgi:ribosome biogenesis GTPase A